MAGLISDWLRARKQARRIREAEAEIMARPFGGAPHGLAMPLVVSLTSYPKRFGALHLVLHSLLTQSVRADRVVLWLDEGHEQQLPKAIIDLPGLEVRTCAPMRSYAKIVPTLRAWPDAHIVTADDDVYYGRDWLAGLVANAGAGVVAHRAHRVTLKDGLPRSYDDWQRNIDAPDRGKLIFPTGVGGVLYAPGVFHPEVTNEALFKQLVPLADDVWLYWMHRLAGSQPQKIGGRFRIVEWPETQTQNLRSGNLSGDGNDQAIRAMIGHFGFPD